MYDAIIVGARCAGSSTAMLRARRPHGAIPDANDFLREPDLRGVRHVHHS